MSMFCYQCQEAARNTGCTIKGVCGKNETTSGLQDLLIYNLKGIALYGERLYRKGKLDNATGRFVAEALFSTITNANFDDSRFISLINEAQIIKKALKGLVSFPAPQHECATWFSENESEYLSKSAEIGVLSTANEDIRSLRELIIYGLKGMAAYIEHAAVLKYEENKLYGFIMEALAATTKNLEVDDLVQLVLKTGEYAVDAMALLDRANTESYGNPEITEVKIGTGDRPGILISGHDLKDMEELLEQSKGMGIDIYTHSEMLPANYYPAFKKYDHFYGNYGNAWWKQDKEFNSFNGPVLMTTNCMVPVKDSYKDRIFTTGMTGFSGIPHIEPGKNGRKDFSRIIELAKKCPPPTELEKGTLTGGFAHNQVFSIADKVVDAVKSGAIKKFVVMAGCDGRQNGRNYYTDMAREMPKDSVILTAGCAKYRYNKLNLGDINGIPRVLDAGQCNDSYSLVMIALKLKEELGIDDINDLPISYDIAWYEQKAVIVLLALLFLGVKGIRLGPTLPAFLSPNVVKVLVEKFDIKPIGDVKSDIEAIFGVVPV